MKKIKKESLKLEKEVITRLTQDHLSQVVGGAVAGATFNSVCLCNSVNVDCPKTRVVDNCTVIVMTNNGKSCNCFSDVCDPYPLTKNNCFEPHQ